MGKCFINEDVEFDILYSKNERNIIKVNNRKEIFFEVYESNVGDKKIVLEKIGEYGGLPIVTVEFKENGKIYTCEALLEDDDKNQLVVNEENLYFLRDEKNLKNNIYVENTEVEVTSGSDVVSETKLNIEHTYDEKIKEYEDKKFTFLEDIENQFEEKINLLKDDIGEKLDTFFEKLDKKKEEIISEKLDEVTSEIDNKFELLKTELQSVEQFSKNNIDSILEKKVTDIDSSVNNFLEDLTKTYKEKFKDSDKKSVGNYLNLKSLTEKYNKNKEDTDNKIKDLFDLKNKLLEQDDLIIKNKELLEFINDEFNTINNKFLYLTEKENEKYNELLAAVSKKDVVEYKTILKEKIQDVELGLVKEELRDEISENFRNEITSLKRYAEMSSGGGSVAKQFARGGTMEGTLNVVGDILSGGKNLTDVFNTDTSINLQDVTNNGNTTTNSISTNNTITADTIIATTLLSAGTLNIGFELSGFNVTGSISANGDITGNRVIAINTLSANGNLYPQTIALDGEVIVANGDGNLEFGHGEKLRLQIRNDEGSDISAGTPVYSKGEIGGSNRIKVGIADANYSSKMPAIGIAETTLNTTDAKDGFAIINGVYNENISGFTNLIEGKNLYVASGGGLTNVKPTGVNNLIQNIGTILKVGGGGSILQGMKVSSIDRTNDIPNLSAKAIFYGQGDYYAQQSLSAAVLDSTGVTLQDGSGSFTSNISANGGLTATNIHGVEIFENGNRVCTTIPAFNLQTVTDNGNTTTNVISTNNAIFTQSSTISGSLTVGGNACIAGNILGDLDFGSRNSNDTLIKVCSDGNDITLFEASADSGAVGVCAQYIGSGSGDDNIFKISTDGQGNAIVLDQSGDIGIGTPPIDGNSLTIDGPLSSNGKLEIGGAIISPTLSTNQTTNLSTADVRIIGQKITIGTNNNLATGINSFVGGGGIECNSGISNAGRNIASGNRAATLGGAGTIASGNYSIALGGNYSHTVQATANRSLAGGGCSVLASGVASVAMGGYVVQATGNKSVALGGQNVKAVCLGSVAIGGGNYPYAQMCAKGCNSAVIGGGGRGSGGGGSGYDQGNKACGDCSGVFVGKGGVVLANGKRSAIIGGTDNKIVCPDSMILGRGLTAGLSSTVFVNNLSAQDTICGKELYDNGNRVCTTAEADTLATVTSRGNTTTCSISTNNLLTTNSIKSCSVSACNLFVDDAGGKLDLKNNSICFTTNDSNARIEHHDRSGSACNLIINASDNCATSVGNGGNLILSAGSSYNSSGSTGGDVIICAGDGHIGAGDIILNACDSGLSTDGELKVRACSTQIEKGYLRVCNKLCTTNMLIASAIKIGTSQVTNEFTVDTTGRIHSEDGAHIGGALSAQSFESQTISATNCAGFRVNVLAGNKGGKIAMGHPTATIATGNQSVAIGGGYDASATSGPVGQVKASGLRSVAIGGHGSLASGVGAVALGGFYAFCSRACGNYSLAIHDGHAKGNYAVAIGRNSLACCNASIAIGGYNTAKSKGLGAIALGGGIYSNTKAYGDYSAVIGGGGQGGQGSGDYCHNLICKGATKAAIIGGGLNTIQKAACNSVIIGGSHNIALSGCSFILGHGLIGAKEKTVFVNNLSAQDDICVNGQLLGGVSQNKICNSSFTLADSDNGKNIFIDTTSDSVNITVNCMTSGFATRFIYEGGSNPISFISGAGLSGLNSYLGRTQMNVIHSQADINFRSERYAFLGGNLA